MKPRRQSHRNERGVVIIWTAFFMLMMLGFVALGIDVAKVMATRTELQNAADAAALAGASGVNLATGQLDPDSATARAQQTSAMNKAFVDAPVSVTLLAGDVQVNTVDRTVKVTVRRNPSTDGSMITHVAQVLGITSVEVSATATAKLDGICEQCEKLTPLGALPGQGGFEKGCNHVYTLVAGQGGGIQGNHLTLAFPPCDEGPCADAGSTGSNRLRCLLEHGYSCCLAVGENVQTEPGSNTSAVREGLQARWDADRVQEADICYSDYLARGGSGQRVVNVPVIESLGNGRSDVRIVSFAAFFLRRRPSGGGINLDIIGEFVYDVAPGRGGCASDVFTVRLIE